MNLSGRRRSIVHARGVDAPVVPPEVIKAAPPPAIVVQTQKTGGACPICGKRIGRGIAMHIKSCKG